VRSPTPVLRRARGAALTALNAPDWLARLYGGTDKFEHGYIAYYRRVLGTRRFREMTVFEIGVGGYESTEPGGSLQLWRDYFPRSTIVGLDINEKHVAYGPRVKFVRVDQSSAADLEAVVAAHGAPDIVIDDGSHVGDHQLASFDCLWPQLRAGGAYVVEDIGTSYEPDFGGGKPAPPGSAIGLAERLLSDVQARDPYFEGENARDTAPVAHYHDVAAVLTFPGIVFIEKV
jgi:hypothetical protein